MKRRRYEDDEDYYYGPAWVNLESERKRSRREHWCENENESYSRLIDKSTGDFISKHLVTSYQQRRRLLEECEYYLNGRKGCDVKVQIDSKTYNILYDALNDQARHRLHDIQNVGSFRVGDGVSSVNTIVVSITKTSSYEGIILQYEKSYNPEFDLVFKIDFKTEVNRHFQNDRQNGSDLVDHFSIQMLPDSFSIYK